MKSQLDLFGTLLGTKEPAAPELDFTEDSALSSRLPGHVLFGTSSWTFPGWSGIIYPPKTTEKTLRERGLELYARSPLLRTVGIDRSYYRPLTAAELAGYAAQLPPHFPCVIKVPNVVTSRVDPTTREANTHFLDPVIFEDLVLAPAREAFRDHVGAFVFEFAPMRAPELPRRGEFPDRLDRFFAKLPRDFRYAVEIRNRELFTPAYLSALRTHGVSHVLNFWERMPTLGEQLKAPGVFTADFVVSRLLIPPGERYAEKKAEFAPFNRIVTAQPALYEDLAELAQAARKLNKFVYVIVNNKVEGSSPLTIRGLARRIAE